ncbi:LPP20 family lipoprotein [Shewanella youngdeokensis]|uniref:LPP20 family lipoprotein n=1 Tax=Shewanella youngdeokensis TaxID=2999068 RepID=A0ABZ0K1A5_9GAMM|nr:LPP20 family lipoprotein [Shewanella sp. DAU334]
MKPIIVLMLSLLLGGCASQDRYVQYETEAPTSFPTLTAVGYATLASQPSPVAAQRVLMAMQASKIAAYRELAEQVYGQHLSATSQVSEWMMSSDEIKASVSGVIRGATVVKSYPAGEHYVTELELDFEQVWALYQQQNRSQKVKQITYF